MKNFAWSWTFGNGDLASHMAFTYRSDVQKYLGKVYNKNDPKEGWKKAYRLGHRAVKVKVIKL